jgi:hypothetical protein
MKLPVRLIAVLTLSSSLSFLSSCNSSVTAPEALSTQAQPNEASASNQNNEINSFRDAVNKAMQAANLAQVAKTSDEWSKVAESWQQAIDLMKAVPKASVNYKTAQEKANAYQNNLKYAQRNSVKVSKERQPEQASVPKLSLSQKAAQLKNGMTYKEVVALLGRTPDTVVNDQIRRDLGEPVQGVDLVTFDWKNDDSACQPVSVSFAPSGMTTTGWNEGRTCTGSSIFNEPFGKPCAETTLCKLP